MVASHPSRPMLSEDNPLVLIRSRVEEKRLFEARFLCRKLAQILSDGQCALLEQELNGSLAQIERWRQDAREMLACGEHAQAGELYNRIEAIAIDVPGVTEEKKALAGAEALAARLLKPGGDETGPAQRENVQLEMASREERSATEPTSHPQPPLKTRRMTLRPWLLVGVVGGVSILVLLFFAWSSVPKRPSLVPPTTNRIVLNPLLSTNQERDGAPPPSAAPEAPVTQSAPPIQTANGVNPPAASSPPALKLGGLRIEQSEHP